MAQSLISGLAEIIEIERLVIDNKLFRYFPYISRRLQDLLTAFRTTFTSVLVEIGSPHESKVMTNRISASYERLVCGKHAAES